MRYSPDQDPDAEQWLALDESDRLRIIEDYHRQMRIQVPNVSAHAVVHCIVENQIAEGATLPVKRTIARLITEGLDRHDAIHAVGKILMEHMNELMKDPSAEQFDCAAYFAELETITAKRWRNAV